MENKLIGETIAQEERASVLKEYFSHYLMNIRGLTASSVKHYIDALNNISKRLVEIGVVKTDIYEILDLDRLFAVRELLFSDADFKELNTRGNHMYSAGLNNYFRFVEGTDFQSMGKEVKKMDIPVKAKVSNKMEVLVHKRSNILRTHTLVFANYQCELDNSHESFVTEKTHKPYMEAHHAIPMKWQAQFDYSLDVYANMISLCPICHRKIHYGLKNERLKMLHQIYTEREERLMNSGIVLSREEFTELVIK